MKKLALLIGCIFAFTSCDVEDDHPWQVPALSEVTNADLPEFFEQGKTYEIDITYLLPSACHVPAGLEVSRGGSTGSAFRDIYVAGVSTRSSDMEECDEENEDLETTDSFNITINVDEPYTFHLWTGVDDDNKNVYTTIEVPVGEPEETTEE